MEKADKNQLLKYEDLTNQDKRMLQSFVELMIEVDEESDGELSGLNWSKHIKS